MLVTRGGSGIEISRRRVDYGKSIYGSIRSKRSDLAFDASPLNIPCRRKHVQREAASHARDHCQPGRLFNATSMSGFW
jgi:hypothetical protein